ncbi:MAG TPA: hypothetical protein VGR27_10230, partial [Longimicrobiaceae bacterium]|nr:hypothetical protein [Longimicrobiaceae bacterium]
MIERLREMGLLPTSDEPEEEEGADEGRFHALRLLTAELFLATGVNATLHFLRGRSRSADAGYEMPELDGADAAGYGRSRVAGWTPALLAPLAGIAQIVHTFRPSDATRYATRVLNGAALALGAAGLADSIRASTRGEEPFSLAPLLLSYVALLAYFVERQEAQVAEEREELEHRARIVERFVPRRRTKLDRIVVHV